MNVTFPCYITVILKYQILNIPWLNEAWIFTYYNSLIQFTQNQQALPFLQNCNSQIWSIWNQKAKYKDQNKLYLTFKLTILFGSIFRYQFHKVHRNLRVGCSSPHCHP